MGRGDLMNVVKRYKLSVIRLVSTRNVMYNIIKIANSVICYVESCK